MYYVGDAEHTLWFADALGGEAGLRFRRLKLADTLRLRGEISQLDFSSDSAAAVAQQEDCFLRAGRMALSGIESGCFVRPDETAVLPGDDDWRAVVVDSGAIDHLLVLLGRYLLIDLYSAKMLDKKKYPETSPCCGAADAMSRGS